MKNRKYIVYIISLAICLLFTLWGTIPEDVLGAFSLKQVTDLAQDFITGKFGWLYVLLIVSTLVLCIVLLFSKYGSIKLGKDDDQPSFRYTSWLAMLFSAGMGIGLIFWGVSEPLEHLHNPAVASVDMAQNARDAMRYSFFHWGLHPWALYALVGLIIAYTTFRKGKPALISESVSGLFKEKSRPTISLIVNVIAIIATVFGVATSLGLGAQQIAGGLNFLNSNIPNNFPIQLLVVVIVTALYLISATTGLDKGVKILSNTNIILAILLMLFVLLLGPTAQIMDLFVQTIGGYFQTLLNMSFRMSIFDTEGREWLNKWTLFYWAWWIAWAPYVSSFIARISKGRTIREFIIGVLLIPTVFTFLWFTVFGGSAVFHDLLNQSELYQTIVTKGTETGLFALLQTYGSLGKIITGIAVLLISTFFITSADSSTFVLGMFSTGGDLVPSQKIKIIWGIVQSMIAAILLYAGGLQSLQAVSVLASFPFLFVVILMIVQFFKSLQKEKVKESS